MTKFPDSGQTVIPRSADDDSTCLESTTLRIRGYNISPLNMLLYIPTRNLGWLFVLDIIDSFKRLNQLIRVFQVYQYHEHGLFNPSSAPPICPPSFSRSSDDMLHEYLAIQVRIAQLNS